MINFFNFDAEKLRLPVFLYFADGLFFCRDFGEDFLYPLVVDTSLEWSNFGLLSLTRHLLALGSSVDGLGMHLASIGSLDEQAKI